VEQATLPLARLTGACSGAIARVLGLDVQIAGSELILPNANLVIGAQCSGISSIVSLLGLVLLLAYALVGPAWGKILLVVMAVPLAMLGNIVRVASLVFVAHYFGSQAAFRFYHAGSGAVVFIILVLLIFPLTRLLRCRTVRPEVL
jgi:exosortase